MSKQRIKEMETHHNQALTSGAKARLPEAEARKKVLALGLDQKEQAALAYLGGLPALKQLLCPEGCCICCRQAAAKKGSKWDAFCEHCEALAEK